jgi:hypothetical protein
VTSGCLVVGLVSGQVLTALGPGQLVAIATGRAPLGWSAATVAADAAGRRTADVCWLGDDTTSADAPAWLSLHSAEAWSSPSFVARSLDAALRAPPRLHSPSTLRRYPTVATLPAVSGAVQASAPTNVLAANSRCVKSSVAQDSGATVTSWTMWEGPIPK